MNPHTTMLSVSVLFFFNDTATTEIYTLSLHDALPISESYFLTDEIKGAGVPVILHPTMRSEEHTSELQSHHDLVCRLLLEKTKNSTRTDSDGRHPPGGLRGDAVVAVC